MPQPLVRRWLFRVSTVIAELALLGFVPVGFWPSVIFLTLWATGIRVIDEGHEAAVFARQVRRAWT